MIGDSVVIAIRIPKRYYFELKDKSINISAYIRKLIEQDLESRGRNPSQELKKELQALRDECLAILKRVDEIENLYLEKEIEMDKEIDKEIDIKDKIKKELEKEFPSKDIIKIAIKYNHLEEDLRKIADNLKVDLKVVKEVFEDFKKERRWML